MDSELKMLTPEQNSDLEQILAIGKSTVQLNFFRTSDEPRLSILARSEEEYKKYEEFLAGLSEKNLHIKLGREETYETRSKFTSQIDYLDLCDRMFMGIRTDIQSLIDNPPDDPIYVFIVAISPDHNNMETFLNTQSMGDSGSSPDRVYESIDCMPLIYSKEMKETWAQYREAVSVIEEVRREESKYMNTDYTFRTFRYDYMRKFTQMAVLALRRNLPLLDQLNKTDDFVAFVEDFVGSQDNFHLALETVPFERVKEIRSEQWDRIKKNARRPRN